MLSDNRTTYRSPNLWLTTTVWVLLSACAGQSTVDLSAGHLVNDDKPELLPAPEAPKPQPVPKPVPAPPVATYTVVVKDVPAIDLLFSLARDAGLELDMQGESKTSVTLNAVDRPMREILERIAEQAGLRFQLRGNNLVMRDDVPYWHNYMVDYVNVSRNSEGEVGVATEIATSGGTVGEQTSSQGDAQGNLSKTTVKNVSNNDFWAALEESLEAIVRNNTQGSESSSPVDNDPVIINGMAGIVTVYGNQKQQSRVQEHLDRVTVNSQRQVLIEMTIVEVRLSDNYQAGVDWQRLSANGGLENNGASLRSQLLGSALNVPPVFSLGYNDDDPNGSNISATVRLLQQFGDTKVLSSPKIMALNNQTALLKVVNENVYFTIELDIREATTNIPERRTYTSEVHTVPVGLVLSVTPQISAAGFVSLNVRPTISRITGYAADPAPRLAGADFDNLIPEIQVREIESLLQVQNGRTVVLGGLMQNERESSKDGIPGLSRIPKVGKLFSYTSDEIVKTELVIFLKPTIIENAVQSEAAVRLSDYYDFSEQQQATSTVEYR
jgi:general secretion pathway protein D